jgi:hypothetical protein
MSNRYHPSIIELVRAFDAGELATPDLEILARATDERLDLEAAVKSGIGWWSKSEVGKGFLRALSRLIN